MTKEEYNKRKEALITEHLAKVDELNAEYCMSNRLASIGDIITSDHYSLKVVGWKIETANFLPYPLILYHGIQCTRKGMPTKKQYITDMWESIIKYINGKRINNDTKRTDDN